jgi:hypothetical protein
MSTEFTDVFDLETIRVDGHILPTIKINFKDGSGHLTIHNHDTSLPYGEVLNGIYEFIPFSTHGELKKAIRHSIRQIEEGDALEGKFNLS